MKRALILFFHLMIVWLLFSGHYTATLITYGALSCATVVALVWHLGILDQEALPTHFGIRPFLYIPWLLKEVVVSNLSVAKVILDPKLPIHPRMLRIEASQKTDVGRVIYANSITLTPGTVTLDVRGEKMLVHALTRDSAEGLLSGEMDRRVTQLEEKAVVREAAMTGTGTRTETGASGEATS
ncbi:MAG: Na+/H+ antiporter subunit E [Myxococcota bacterium]